jgi:hypothetical protein
MAGLHSLAYLEPKAASDIGPVGAEQAKTIIYEIGRNCREF